MGNRMLWAERLPIYRQICLSSFISAMTFRVTFRHRGQIAGNLSRRNSKNDCLFLNRYIVKL